MDTMNYVGTVLVLQTRFISQVVGEETCLVQMRKN